MTAGAADVAYTPETSYNGGVSGSPTRYLPGTDVAVEDLTLENFLTRVRKPDSVIPDRSVAQQLEGALSVSFNLSTSDYHDLIFNGTDGSGNDTLTTGHVPSAEWYMGLEYPDTTSSTATVERKVQGWVATEVTIAYTTEEIIRVTMTGPYATETKNTSITATSPTGGSDESPFHGATFTVASGQPWSASLNSAELTMSNLARLMRGTSREPSDAIRAAPTIELSVDADIRTADNLSRTYTGAASGTSPSDTVSSVQGDVSLDNSSGTVSTYEFGQLRPNDYNWQDLVNGEATASESVTFFADGSFKQTA